MKTLNVDVAVVGAGTAGLTAYSAAKAAGANTVIVEGGDYGTTFARVGCIPSKLLIAADEGHIAGENAARLALGKQMKPGLRRAGQPRQGRLNTSSRA